MKKFFMLLSTVMLVALLALTMAGCDKSGSIKKAFEKEGYTVTTVDAKDSSELSALLSEEQKEELDKYAVISCTKGLSFAIIIKFPSENTIKEVLGEEDYEKAAESNFLNGNCYLISISSDAINIFKNA